MRDKLTLKTVFPPFFHLLLNSNLKNDEARDLSDNVP